jgi:hypothetical protein
MYKNGAYARVCLVPCAHVFLLMFFSENKMVFFFFRAQPKIGNI